MDRLRKHKRWGFAVIRPELQRKFAMIAQMLIAIFSMVLLMGCASQMSQQPPSASDPANPSAPETPFSPPPNRFQTEAPVTVEKPSTEPTAPTIYTCPMHPEITQSSQGECPTCGMKLVPAKNLKTDSKSEQ